MDTIPITIIIPTYNEKINIIRALESCAKYVNQIIIADSTSTDNTLDLAKSYTNNINVLTFPSNSIFSTKMNEASLSSIIQNDWVFRLDADEVIINPELFFRKIENFLKDDDLESDIVGIFIIRRYYFLGNWVRYGDMYPRFCMRLWKKGRVLFDSRLIDEKMIYSGKSITMDIEIADINQAGYKSWLKKHIFYAKSEALHNSNFPDSNTPSSELDIKIQAEKVKYYKYPIFIRPILYFFYRFFLKKGYKDNLIGISYHFLHAFVYRELVDFNILKNKIFRNKIIS